MPKSSQKLSPAEWMHEFLMETLGSYCFRLRDNMSTRTDRLPNHCLFPLQNWEEIQTGS